MPEVVHADARHPSGLAQQREALRHGLRPDRYPILPGEHQSVVRVVRTNSSRSSCWRIACTFSASTARPISPAPAVDAFVFGAANTGGSLASGRRTREYLAALAVHRQQVDRSDQRPFSGRF